MKYVLLTPAVLMGSCASMEPPPVYQDVHVTTTPATKAACVLKNQIGEWHVETPGTVNVQRHLSNLKIACTAPGYQGSDWFMKRTTTKGLFKGAGGAIGGSLVTNDDIYYPASVTIKMNEK